MDKIAFALLLLSLSLLVFDVAAICRALSRLEKTQNKISEDFQMFINFYLTKK